MKMHSTKWIALTVCLGALAACDNHTQFKDLDDQIRTLEKTNTVNKNQIPAFSVQSRPITYKIVTTRTPFDETHHGDKVTGHTNPLMGYALNALRFLGSVSQHNKIWAYTLTPDNKVHPVTIGDTIGDHQGKVTKISTNEIEIVEPQSGGTTPNTQRIITLQLKEEG